MPPANIFSVEAEQQVLVVVPHEKVSGFSESQIKEESAAILKRLADDDQVVGLVIDFHQTRYIGSSMLEAMLSMAQGVQQRSGKIALCSLSDVVAEIVHVARFDTVWPVYPTRAEAITAVRNK